MTVFNSAVPQAISSEAAVVQIAPPQIASSVLGSKKPKPKSYSMTINGTNRDIAYEQLFAHGHDLWLSKKYSAAIPIFELLAKVTDRGPRASILLAHCYAMEQHFSDCSRTLCLALPSSECGMIAAELHDIFVMWKCTFFKDVRRDLEAFVSNHPELPTPALLLADFFMLAGRYEESLHYLDQAKQRDRIGGAIGMVASAQTEAVIKKKAKRSEPKK